MPTQPTVDQYLEALDHPLKAEVGRLRRAILAAHPGITERVKWNAPSFCWAGDDRVTFGLRKGALQIVFHRGVAPKDARGFRFDDPSGLIAWKAADRGLMEFTSRAQLAAAIGVVAATALRWMEATVDAPPAKATKRAPATGEKKAPAKVGKKAATKARRPAR